MIRLGNITLMSLCLLLVLFASADASRTPFFGGIKICKHGLHKLSGSSSSVQRIHDHDARRSPQSGLSMTRRGAFLSTTIRGGALNDNDDSEGDFDEEDEEEGDDDDDDQQLLFGFEEDDGGDLSERDFAEDTTVDRMRLAWDRTPPLTKAYISATFATTLFGYLMNGNKFPEILTLDWNKVLKQLQIWRLLTSFLNFGPFGIGFFLTAHFVWTYMATMERICHNRPYDFWIMILFGQLSMVIGYPLLRMSPQFLGHNLSTYLVYIWARHHEGMQVSMFDLFTARAELLPWIFLAQTFLLEGELPFLDALGIAFGHSYHHLQTTGALKAPDALVRWYQDSQSELAVKLRKLYQPISADFEIMM